MQRLPVSVETPPVISPTLLPLTPLKGLPTAVKTPPLNPPKGVGNFLRLRWQKLNDTVKDTWADMAYFFSL